MPTLKQQRHRALTLLAGSRDGCTEAVMLAHGFTIMVAAGLTEYSVRKGYCNQMGADLTSVRRQLWCTNGVKPPPVDWARLLGF